MYPIIQQNFLKYTRFPADGSAAHHISAAHPPTTAPASCLSDFHTTAQEIRPLQRPDTIPRYSYGQVSRHTHSRNKTGHHGFGVMGAVS